jgi:hypothetical protein
MSLESFDIRSKSPVVTQKMLVLTISSIGLGTSFGYLYWYLNQSGKYCIQKLV